MPISPRSTVKNSSLAGQSNGKTKFIVVAENDKFYSQIFKIKLTQEGIDVVVVKNGVKVLQVVKERRPDLILLDLVMPIKNGFEILHDLQVDPNFKNIPVIILSSLGQNSDVERAKAMGAKDCLVKSNISFQEAMILIKKYLGE